MLVVLWGSREYRGSLPSLQISSELNPVASLSVACSGQHRERLSPGPTPLCVALGRSLKVQTTLGSDGRAENWASCVFSVFQAVIVFTSELSPSPSPQVLPVLPSWSLTWPCVALLAIWMVKDADRQISAFS